jgi:hypothetical protein
VTVRQERHRGAEFDLLGLPGQPGQGDERIVDGAGYSAWTSGVSGPRSDIMAIEKSACSANRAQPSSESGEPPGPKSRMFTPSFIGCPFPDGSTTDRSVNTREPRRYIDSRVEPNPPDGGTVWIFAPGRVPVS